MSDSPLRIMWMSNAPWVGSGYGIQAAHVIPFLKSKSEVDEVSLFAFYGIQGGLTKQLVGKYWIPCYPSGATSYGEDVIGDWMTQSKSNVLITLVDVFVFNPDFGSKGFYWCPYAPIDHDPLPKAFADRFQHSYRPIVYSKFAIRKMQEAGIEHWYAPHGVETDIFKPRPKNRDKDREWAGLKQDSFVVGMVAANKDVSDRKGFNQAFAGFRELLDKHSDCQLYVHAITTPAQGGLDLISLARTYEILDNCRFTVNEYMHAGLCREDLARLYNSFDVLLNPTQRAGFEIPLIEAQSSGVPIIAGDWHSMPELCGSGWLVKPAQKQATPLESFIYIASVESVTDCLLSAYDEKGNESIKRSARDFAMEYDWKYILPKYWGPIVESLAQEVSIKSQMPMPSEEIQMTVSAVPFEGEVVEVKAE